MANRKWILVAEDDANDADLTLRVLSEVQPSIEVVHVSDGAQALNCLYRRDQFVARDTGPPVLVLLDLKMPRVDGFDVLERIKSDAALKSVPVTIFTSSREQADLVRSYVLKHRLARLVPSVHRALREAKERAERKRAEEQLHRSHQQLRALSIHLQHVREEERIHIAREVHDELGQQLTGLKLQLTWLASRLPKDPRALHDKARLIADRIDETIQTVRRIATELRPGVLDSAGLLAALEWQALEFEKETGIRCRVRSSVRDTIWNQDLNTAFFRIFQETLTNVIRHASATKVDVDLWEDGEHLVLEVQDNGRGVSDQELQNTKSIGLIGMRERAALLGGDVYVHRANGKGTSVIVRIPRPSKNLRPGKARFA